MIRQRRLPIVLATLISLGSIWLTQLAAPVPARACSCSPDGVGDIAAAADFPDAVVFIGLVTAMDPAGPGADFSNRFGEMRIERVFKGTLPPLVRVKGGGGGDCTMHLSVAQHMVTVASWRDGVLTPHLCSPYGDPETADGRALVAAAVAAFGTGTVPDAQRDENPTAVPGADPTDMPDDPDLTGFVIGMVGILVGIVLIAVIASAWQRRQDPPAA